MDTDFFIRALIYGFIIVFLVVYLMVSKIWMIEEEHKYRLAEMDREFKRKRLEENTRFDEKYTPFTGVYRVCLSFYSSYSKGWHCTFRVNGVLFDGIVCDLPKEGYCEGKEITAEILRREDIYIFKKV